MEKEPIRRWRSAPRYRFQFDFDKFFAELVLRNSGNDSHNGEVQTVRLCLHRFSMSIVLIFLFLS